MKKRFNTINNTKFKSSYNIAPGKSVPVIIKNSPNKISLMKWGLIPFWAKDPQIGHKMINARAEGIQNKPSFNVPIKTRRCLVPADGFYEWKKIKLEKKEEKFPWFIGLKTNKTFSMAGIYDIRKDAQGKEIQSYAIITTNSNELLKPIHERMPVIIKKRHENLWLDRNSKLSTILKLLIPYPENQMKGYPVSFLVNNPGNNSKDLIKELR